MQRQFRTGKNLMNFRIARPTGFTAVALALSGLGVATHCDAQTVTPPAILSRSAAPIITPTAPASPVSLTVDIPEGTEIRIAIEDPLSSKTSAAGDEFAFKTTESIRLSDGTVLPVGYSGRGEVTDVEKKGMLGKAGHLNVRLEYITIGNVRVRLRRSTGIEGKSGVGTTVALALIVSPLFLMHHGAEAVIPKGQAMTAIVDEDAHIANPPPSPS
jgi:hypothetical protein